MTTTMEDIVRELIEGDIGGSCCGCSNVGHDSLLHLAQKYPEVHAVISSLGYTLKDPDWGDTRYVKESE